MLAQAIRCSGEQMSRYFLMFIFLCAVLFSTTAPASAGMIPWTQENEFGWTDDTRPGSGYFNSPYDACDYQRSIYDPTAVNQQPTEEATSPLRSYRCVWTNRTNTILPGNSTLRCVKGVPNSIYTEAFTKERPIPSTCVAVARPPCKTCSLGPNDLGAPSQPKIGNPVLGANGAKMLDRLDYVDATGRLKLAAITIRHLQLNSLRIRSVGDGVVFFLSMVRSHSLRRIR